MVYVCCKQLENSIVNSVAQEHMWGDLECLAMAYDFPHEGSSCWTVDGQTALLEAEMASWRQCANCGIKWEKMKKCGRCKQKHYCSKECQLEAWPEHKKVCTYAARNVKATPGTWSEGELIQPQQHTQIVLIFNPMHIADEQFSLGFFTARDLIAYIRSILWPVFAYYFVLVHTQFPLC